jgi:glycosyltransferase involved in cell wall biosynthesis
MPQISVVIPTYNRATLLIKALKSVQDQTLQPKEVIIVDDGSSDDTFKHLSSFHSTLNIVVLHQENSGVSSARNKGIQNASGTYIAFLDSDDTWHAHKLEQQMQFHQQHPEILCSYTDELWIRNEKILPQKSHQKKEHPTFLNSLQQCKIGASTFMAHQKLFEKVGYFDPVLRVCEDYDFWLRILLNHSIGFLNQCLTTKYAGHENQLSFNTALIDTYRIQALKKHLKSPYKKEVLQTLIHKTKILLKGAIKHNNQNIIKTYSQELHSFEAALKAL